MFNNGNSMSEAQSGSEPVATPPQANDAFVSRPPFANVQSFLNIPAAPAVTKLPGPLTTSAFPFCPPFISLSTESGRGAGEAFQSQLHNPIPHPAFRFMPKSQPEYNRVAKPLPTSLAIASGPRSIFDTPDDLNDDDEGLDAQAVPDTAHPDSAVCNDRVLNCAGIAASVKEVQPTALSKSRKVNPKAEVLVKARPQWAKIEEVAAYRASWSASSEWGRKPKKYLVDMSARNYPAQVEWLLSNGLWKKQWGDVDCVSPERSVEVRAKSSQRVWNQLSHRLKPSFVSIVFYSDN